MDEFGATSPFANITQSGVDYSLQNKGVTPIFFIEPMHDAKATEAAGAVRMYEQEMVHIKVSGDFLNTAASPVTAEIKERFADAYRQWKEKGIDRHIEGTPIKNWPMIAAIRIAEFEAMGIFSVENLAAVSDTNIQKLVDGRVWREKAIAWLASSKDNAIASKYAAENERLRGDMDDLRQQLAELSSRLSSDDDEPVRRKPGRPRKEDAAA